ncbi:isochorismatase family protein [uncultured Tessaracoccus sp.]|uniref:isochorismatase family protein n=1 Tax=uncultured Tessaracoccus sp. TaxID=905023 RepID=UPI0025DDD234|nr:isochorismatase family protein [uncultured Tessaracoccus sp.]
MTSKTQPEPIRDPQTDHLLTPENAVVALIDYQPEQYATVGSATKDGINLGVVTLARFAATFELPTVVSTVAVDMGVNEPTARAIMDVLPDDQQEIDRTGVNAWEDEDFRAAIEASGRKKVIIAGLWTEVCLAYPTLDMLREGYEVYPVIDAVGGVTPVSHRTAIERMVQAGAQQVTSLAVGAELMRNWARPSGDLFRPVMQDYFRGRDALGLGN